MKSEVKKFFTNWMTYFPIPVVVVDYDFRILLSNNMASTLCDFDFTKPQYLENYFDNSLLPKFIDFKSNLRDHTYAEEEILIEHLGHIKMIGHYFSDDLGYYMIAMIPQTYKDNFINLRDRFFAVLQNMNDSVVITDENQKILEVNPAFSKITGYSAQEVKGRFPTILSSGLQNEEFYKGMYENMSKKGMFEGELIDRKKSGELIHVKAKIIPLLNDNNEAHEYIGILKDITELKSLKRKINTDLHKDPLTGVHTRDSFLNILEIKCELSNLENNVALLFIDLNRFKQVNDTYGHQSGDLVLSMAASRMKKILRGNDLIGRYGGDEFVVLLERISVENTYVIAEKINDLLSEPYIFNGQIIDFVSGSIGVAFAPIDSRSVDILIEKADEAMYHGKKTKKINSIIMSSSLSKTQESDKTLRTELINAVENEEFYIRIQPILDVKSRQLVGGEVLARWLNLYFNEVMPGTFIPLTQTLDLSKKLDNKILNLAIEKIKDKKLPKDFFINVNFSAEQFKDIHFVEYLKSLSVSFPWLPEHLVIEITESTMMDNLEQTSQYLNDIKELGFKIAIDDFGTGFSSLSYLKHFSIDYLKIDISFIENIEKNEKDKDIIKTIVMLAEAIGAKTIVEGIERETQYEIIKKIDVDYMQGFLFYKPLLSVDFFELIEV